MRTPVRLSNIDGFMGSAERAIALLDRCRPLNALRETERVMQAWDAGHVAVPEYAYATPPAMAELAKALELVAAHLEDAGPWGRLYASRARELVGEARVVESLGSKAFRDRARERFPIDAGPFGRRAAANAVRWASLTVQARGERVPSDDARDPRSLVSVVRALVGAERLPVRVATTFELSCAAATGDGVVLVQSGLVHRPECARRIALHEVLGHALPRVRAKAESPGLYSIGTARGSEDEEGRALLIEERNDSLDDERRRELGVRHLAAVAVHDGADWVDVVRLSLGYGLFPRQSVRLASRVFRGGGLGREIIYLTGRERVLAALGVEPSIERFLERGRISVDAARTLAALGPPPPSIAVSAPREVQRNVATTGA